MVHNKEAPKRASEVEVNSERFKYEVVRDRSRGIVQVTENDYANDTAAGRSTRERRKGIGTP